MRAQVVRNNTESVRNKKKRKEEEAGGLSTLDRTVHTRGPLLVVHGWFQG